MGYKVMFLILLCFILVTHSLSQSTAPKITETQSSVPISGNDSSFSFVVWGHPRGRTTGDPPLHFEEILAQITELKTDLVVITGDAIHGMWGEDTDPAIIRKEWEIFDVGLSKLKIPVYRLPGNHDVHNNITRDIYLKRYPRVPFAFT